jgi:hypothetical protein
MTLSEILEQLEQRATEAERYEATARVDIVLRSVIEDLRDVDHMETTAPNGNEPDQLVDISKAAEILGVKVRYLYDNGHALPFTRRIGRQLRFSTRGIERYLAKQR